MSKESLKRWSAELSSRVGDIKDQFIQKQKEAEERKKAERLEQQKRLEAERDKQLAEKSFFLKEQEAPLSELERYFKKYALDALNEINDTLFSGKSTVVSWKKLNFARKYTWQDSWTVRQEGDGLEATGTRTGPLYHVESESEYEICYLTTPFNDLLIVVYIPKLLRERRKKAKNSSGWEPWQTKVESTNNFQTMPLERASKVVSPLGDDKKIYADLPVYFQQFYISLLTIEEDRLNKKLSRDTYLHYRSDKQAVETRIQEGLHDVVEKLYEIGLQL